MKSLSGDVILNVTAHTAWEMYRSNETVRAPRCLLQLSICEEMGLLEACVSSNWVQDYVKESTEWIDKVEIGSSVTYRVIAGCLREMYSPYKVTISFCPVPGFEKEKCIARWEAEYEPLNSTVPAPERAKKAALGFPCLFEKFYCSMK